MGRYMVEVAWGAGVGGKEMGQIWDNCESDALLEAFGATASPFHPADRPFSIVSLDMA